MTAEQVLRERLRQSIQLSRARAEAELSRATAPAHRRMLEQALASLDAQLADLGPVE